MISTDGRNIDQTLGSLRGEGALQRVSRLEEERPYERKPGEEKDLSYYGLPLLKEAVWKWPIPVYLYVGGLAGGSAALGAAAMLRKNLSPLVRKVRWIAACGALASTALLVQDLGVRGRFIYMLRVFNPRSPMSVGSWILTAFGAAAGLSFLPGSGAAGVVAGVLGLPLSGYTGVLLGNTAVPLWQESNVALPPLFCASAAASAASALEMLDLGRREDRVVRRLAVAGKLAELAADVALEKTVSGVERVGRPLHQSLSGALWKLAKVATAASLAISLARRKPRSLRFVAGLLGTAGALATRFALFHGGKASARDPHAVFAQQA